MAPRIAVSPTAHMDRQADAVVSGVRDWSGMRTAALSETGPSETGPSLCAGGRRARRRTVIWGGKVLRFGNSEHELTRVNTCVEVSSEHE